MTINDNRQYLLTQTFPYDTALLDKLIEREKTIRTEWQIDLHERGEALKKEASNPQEGYAQHKPCRYMAVEALPAIIEGVIALLNKLEANTATRDKGNILKLSQLPWLEYCAIAFSTMINGTMRNENIARVIESIGDNCQTEAKWRHYKEAESGLFDRILEQQHKSSKHMRHINNVLTIAMNRRAEGVYGGSEKPELRFQAWSEDFKRWLGNTYVSIIIATTGLFGLKQDVVTRTKKDSTTRLYTTEKFDKYITETEERIGLFGGFYLPLPVPPRDWTSTQSGGFWTRFGGQKKLIKNWNKGYQEEMLGMSEQLSQTVFPAVNAAQHTAWRINHQVSEVLQQLWANNIAVAGLPQQNDNPLPVCPKCGRIPEMGHACFRDELLLRKWKSIAAGVHRENARLKSLRLAMKYGLEVVDLLSEDERFYYVYQVDFRGRMYPCGILQPQGPDWQKGLLEFADGVELGEHGAKWLAIHTANCWGYDKASFEDRANWVRQNEHWILDCATNPLDCLEWTNADEPFEFLAACFEWLGYKTYGNSFKSHLPVALDGSCSGIQHYSAMLQDEVGAVATNVKYSDDSNGKRDIYKEVADAALKIITADVADAEKGIRATYILAHNLIDRKVVKRAVMTLPYGSRYQSCHLYVSDVLMPKLEALGTGEEEKLHICKYISKTVWDAIPTVVQAAREGMSYLQRLAKLFSGQELPITWETPTGFMVQQSYYSVEGKKISLATGGSIILKNNLPVWQSGKGSQMQITFQRTDQRKIDATRQVSGIAPNFIHSLDASHLMFTVVDAKKHGIQNFALIHDSLGTHAGHTEKFIDIIRNNFFRLYNDFDPLGDLTRHLLGQLDDDIKKKAPSRPQKGNLDLRDIKKARYLFS